MFFDVIQMSVMVLDGIGSSDLVFRDMCWVMLMCRLMVLSICESVFVFIVIMFLVMLFFVVVFCEVVYRVVGYGGDIFI